MPAKNDPDEKLELLKKALEKGGPGNFDVIFEQVTQGVEQKEKLTAQQKYKKLCDAQENILNELQKFPLRMGVFKGSLPGGRAEVRLGDGSVGSFHLHDMEMIKKIQKGDLVWIDGESRAVLYYNSDPPSTGEEVTFERILEGEYVEIRTDADTLHVVDASQFLLNQIKASETKVGDKLISSPSLRFAFKGVPPTEEDNDLFLQYLTHAPPPDVLIERDIGSPHECILKILNHVKTELFEPEKHRHFNIRASFTMMLEGVSGSGKTYSILGVWRRMYELMAEKTGMPIDKLPSRVMKLRAPQVLSHWLGNSDKNVDRFFTEVEELATEKWEGFTLPVLVVVEEIDGLARERGYEPVYDRIMTTLLERVDPSHSGFKDLPVVLLCTTNVPGIVDPAMIRRAGGEIAHFGRLTRDAFSKVLPKHMQCLPMTLRESQMVQHVSDWLFRSGSGHEVAVFQMDDGQTLPKYRSDFLTAGLIDRAMQQAARNACYEGSEEMNPQHIIDAMDAQVKNIVDLVTPHNAKQFVDLPDAVSVAAVERVRPKILEVEDDLTGLDDIDKLLDD